MFDWTDKRIADKTDAFIIAVDRMNQNTARAGIEKRKIIKPEIMAISNHMINTFNALPLNICQEPTKAS